ncbi:hypothetical protein DFA_08218 [Cavenderia fasciculata]|uniref:Transmembrane protein n=1 Tax=Cavenderia fasciculata TaxID=261658 RepID=F4Q5G9_CACFS|nr:uncharacterized protein DFA_08218 [Cavenderia fasciculata]EGG17228.1 hypothetical protein DFA_08218 [Cavenderia fasciculata]|eukprot:XP_004355712.1 hypothetical protein DFA_08218 [Cavenderia fasciculata]
MGDKIQNSYDVNGKPITRTETYQVKEVTHTDSTQMYIYEWADVSPPVDSTITTLLLQVHFTKFYIHMDTQSRQILESVKEEMTQRNKTRDTHFTIYDGINIANFTNSRLFCLDENRIPWYANTFWWAIVNITFLWFPWEVAYGSNLATGQFDVLKRVRITGTYDENGTLQLVTI